MDWLPSLWTNRFQPLKGRGSFHAFSCANRGLVTVFVQFFDRASWPKTGEVPVRTWTLPLPVDDGTGVLLHQTIDHEIQGKDGRHVGQGICLVISSTRDTYTAVTAEDFLFDVGYDIRPRIEPVPAAPAA